MLSWCVSEIRISPLTNWCLQRNLEKIYDEIRNVEHARMPFALFTPWQDSKQEVQRIVDSLEKWQKNLRYMDDVDDNGGGSSGGGGDDENDRFCLGWAKNAVASSVADSVTRPKNIQKNNPVRCIINIISPRIDLCIAV